MDLSDELMSQKPRPDRYGALSEVEGADLLLELALDLRWSWNHAADVLWQRLDPELWESTRNPWVILQTVSRDRRQ